MSQPIRQVYGPMTINTRKNSWWIRFRLMFVPTIVHQLPEGTVVYKLYKGEMFVLAVYPTPIQVDKAGES